MSHILHKQGEFLHIYLCLFMLEYQLMTGMRADFKKHGANGARLLTYPLSAKKTQDYCVHDSQLLLAQAKNERLCLNRFSRKKTSLVPPSVTDLPLSTLTFYIEKNWMATY